MKGFKEKLLTGTLAFTMLLTSAAVQFNTTEVKADTAGSDYKLVWSDEFNGTALNTNNWTYDLGNGGSNVGWGNNEKEYYTNRTDNVYVSDGTLKIKALEQKFNNYNYTSGRIKTAGKQTFKYGRMEARIKLPSLKGVWPAFWMLGVNQKGWPWCGEIDILEPWNTDNFAQGAFHWNTGGEDNSYSPNYIARQLNARYTAYNWYDKTQWHIYAVEWNDKKINYFVDDTLYFSVDVTNADKKDEASKYYYFLLNVAVGGNLPGTTPTYNTLPATMEVDYVRAYQKTSDQGGNTATWTEQSEVPVHTVTFKDENKVMSTFTCYDGETLEIPSVYAGENGFEGWYTSDNQKAINTMRVRGSIELTAKWSVPHKVEQDITEKTTDNNGDNNITTMPSVKKAVIKSAVKKKGKAVIKIKKIAKVSGYQLNVAQNVKFKKVKTINTKKTTVIVKKIKSNKKYYVRVRAYKVVNGTKVYGKWSNVRKVK